MKMFQIIMMNLFGMLTMGILALGSFRVVKQGVYNIDELTFLMFTSFILTVLFSTSANKKSD
jgi:hypothetical protein